MMNTKRRQILKSFCVYGGLAGVTACAQSSDQPQSLMNSEADQARANRFHGVNGAEWVLSTLSELSYIHIYDQDGRIISAPSGLVGQGGGRFTINRIPIKLKVNWREQDPLNPIIKRGMGSSNSVYHEAWSGGKITGSFEIPVAERIPDELLDDLRRDPKGSLRIKVRLHRDGVLLGWDIERRLNPWGLTSEDVNKRNIFIPQAWSHTGGDFKEARAAFYKWDGEHFKGLPTNLPEWHSGIPLGQHLWRWQQFVSLPTANQLNNIVPKIWADQGLFITSDKDVGGENRVKGALYEKGWYIHPKTGKRIETDF